MAEIIQTMGFDASGALNTLKALDGALATLETRLNSSATAFAKFNSQKFPTSKINNLASAVANLNNVLAGQSHAAAAMQQTAQGATQATNAVQGTATALNNLGNAGQTAGQRIAAGANRARTGLGGAKASADGFTTSLKLLSRIVFTQAIIRALTQVRRAFETAAQGASDFQKQIALIQTIDNAGTSFGDLSDRVRELSDSYNIPLTEAAAGVYQTLSNQVGNTAESFEFAAKAAKFAKATNSTLADSVDLLSGALKSYSLDVTHTDRVASILFTTIDKGRITATELSNAIGRLAPITAETGVSMEELSAGLAAISVRGTGTSESITQLRAIVTSFQKPSKSMQAALEQLGFASGDAALRQLGLGDALLQVTKSAGGSQSKIAALFPNVRALSGTASLTGDSLREFASDLEAAKNAGTEFANEKFLIATATDAEKVTASLNKLSNELKLGFGQAVLSLADDFFVAAGGAENVIQITNQLTPALVGATGAFGALRVSTLAANAGFVGTSRSLAALGAVIAAFGLGKTLGTFIDDKNTEKALEGLKKLQDQAEKDAETFEKAQKDKTSALIKAVDEQISIANRGEQELGKIYLRDVAAAKSANDILVANTAASFKKIVDARGKLVDELAAASATARDIQTDSSLRVSDLNRSLETREFEKSLRGLNEIAKATRLLTQARTDSRKAGEALITAGRKGDTDAINRATKRFQDASKLAESAQAIGQRVNNRGLENQATQTLNDLTRQQIRSEQELSRIQESRVKRLDQERVAQQKLTDGLKGQVRVLLENTSAFDSKGNALSGDQLAERAAKRQGALKNIAELALNDNQLDSLGALGLADFVNNFQTQLSQDPLNLQFSVEQSVKSIQAQLTQAFANFRAPLNLAPLEEITGPITSPEGVTRAREEAKARLVDLNSQKDAANKAAEAVAQLNQQFAAVGAELAADEFNDAFNRIAFDDNEALKKVRDSFLAAQKAGDVSQQTITNLQSRLGTLLDDQGFISSEAFARDAERMSQLLLLMDKLRQKQQEIGSSPDVSTLDQQIERTKNAIQASTTGFQSAQTTTAQTALDAERVAIAYNAAALASARIVSPGPAPSNSSQNSFAKGGFVQRFANGGMARGMDTVPVMARAGESFINPRSTQKFFSQIQAINAGQNPAYRQDGGNVTIGDINLTVQGGGSDKAIGQRSGRAILREAERELRRGTSRLR